MKIYTVTDSFHGTFADCDCETVESVWLNKDIAIAVAAATYGGGWKEYDIPESEEVPKYAEPYYEAIKKLRRQGKEVNTANIQTALQEEEEEELDRPYGAVTSSGEQFTYRDIYEPTIDDTDS